MKEVRIEKKSRQHIFHDLLFMVPKKRMIYKLIPSGYNTKEEQIDDRF
jgi:hypothetical protein